MRGPPQPQQQGGSSTVSCPHTVQSFLKSSPQPQSGPSGSGEYHSPVPPTRAAPPAAHGQPTALPRPRQFSPAGPPPSTSLVAEKTTLWTGGVPCTLRVALAVGGGEKDYLGPSPFFYPPRCQAVPFPFPPRHLHTKHRDVHIDVGHSALLQLVEKLLRVRGATSAPRCSASGTPFDPLPCRDTHFCEFRGANEPKLLSPPARKHDRSARTPGAWEWRTEGWRTGSS